jgi:chromosome segregation ATPase
MWIRDGSRQELKNVHEEELQVLSTRSQELERLLAEAVSGLAVQDLNNTWEVTPVEMDELRLTLQQLMDERMAEQAQAQTVDAAHNEVVSAMSAETDHLRASLQQFMEERTAAQAQAQADLVATTGQVDALRADLASTRADLASTRADLASTRGEMALMATKLAGAEAQRGAAVAEADRWEAQLSATTASLDHSGGQAASFKVRPLADI